MAEKLIDMAFTKDELKEEKKEMCVGYNGQPNPYPWGLCISLEKKEMDKLGLKDMPAVGASMHLVATVKVTSVNHSARDGYDEDMRVGLQITSMQLSAAST